MPEAIPGPPGARVLVGGRVRFLVWAPRANRVDVVVEGDPERSIPLEAGDRGWFECVADGVEPGALYRYALDGGRRLPDPASLAQPLGVHGPSQVVSLAYPWSDAGFANPPLHDHVVYEVHVGTFTPEGTFDAAADRLDHLCDLGVTAIEVMPLAQFPGTRNWGYDGVALYAVQHSYGGAEGFQRFVDRCHGAGIAVVLDVVYNHLGPEGNYLDAFGPYFTDAYRTPWGSAVNLDRRGSDEVRRFFVENALLWVTDFHVDALRLDAIHALFDRTARPFLAELASDVHRRAQELGRRVQVIAESPHNDPRVIRPTALGGLGLDAAWNEDFHHALHVALTGESGAYYLDFQDAVTDLATAIGEGYVNAGRYSPSAGYRVGAPLGDLPRSSLVVYSQNHDQVGNRALGERLSVLVDEARLRLAAAATTLTPWVPLLFMGEEWAETNPFLYFVDHGDPELMEAVRRGRGEEFAEFFDGHVERVPDPGSEETFARSRLDWSKPGRDPHRRMLDLYRELLATRKRLWPLRDPAPDAHRTERVGDVIRLVAGSAPGRAVVLLNPAAEAAEVDLPSGSWRLVLDQGGGRGPGALAAGLVRLAGWGFAVFEEEAR